MIVDRIDNWKLYPLGAAWQIAFEFLSSLPPDIEEGRYPIQSDDVFALVTRYKTRAPEEAFPEAHIRYVDIQIVTAGREAIAWNPTDELTIKTPYDKEKDIMFYEQPASFNQVILDIGNFIALFPQDAHTPGLTIGNNTEFVKKVVIKINVNLLKE